jgi:hypothetical protein
MTTSVDVANRALAQIGTRSQLTGDVIDPAQSTEAQYCALLYAPLRDFLLVEGDYGFSLFTMGAVSSLPIVAPWTQTYEFPLVALRVRQLFPTAFVPLDPHPVEWTVMVLSGVKKLMCNQAINSILYTGVPTSEDLWDSIFMEAYTRLLSSALAFALENRIEASKEKLAEAISFAGIANLRDS